MKNARTDTCISRIKENIRKELKQRNKTKQQLCTDLRVNRNYISELKESSQLNKFINIATAIGCSVSDLFKGIDTRE